MKTKVTLAALLLSLVFAFNACKKEDDGDDDPILTEDETVYQLITTEQLFAYQGDTSVLVPAGNSPHGTFKLLFNQTAWEALGSDGKLPLGDTFPEGSLVLKDVIRSGQTRFYAAMYKQPASANATEGWLWYEANLDGSLLESINTKGAGCIGCHRGNANRDFVNSFDLH